MVPSTSATVTYGAGAPRCGEVESADGVTMMDQGNSAQMMVIEGSGGLVAGDASTLAGGCGYAVDGGCAMSQAKTGRGAYPSAGAMRTAGATGWEE